MSKYVGVTYRLLYGFGMVHNYPPTETYCIYRMKYRFPFWKIEMCDGAPCSVFMGYWYSMDAFLRKRNAVAAIIRLRLEGKKVVE
jgi:hypothetical protein